MNPSDTTAVNPRDDGSTKAARMDQDPSRPNPEADPEQAPKKTPGPDEKLVSEG